MGNFGPNNKALRAHLTVLEIHLKIFAEIHLKIFAEICLIFFAEIHLEKFAEIYLKFFAKNPLENLNLNLGLGGYEVQIANQFNLLSTFNCVNDGSHSIEHGFIFSKSLIFGVVHV